MRLTKCVRCEKPFSSKAKRCPNCGASAPGHTLLIVLGAGAALLTAGAVFLGGPALLHSGAASLSAPDPAQTPLVTLGQFNSIEDSMGYDDVTQIIGKPGVEDDSDRAQSGQFGAIPDVETKRYTWTNPDGSSMTLTFRNGELVVKQQVNLR
jgi:Domain of Unknown Function with PDB structure (DUF3862)